MTTLDLSEFEVVYHRPDALVDITTHYCPG